MFGMSGSKPKAKAAARSQAGGAASLAKKTAPVNVAVKLSAAQRDKFERLGGSAWLRAQIDAADAEPGS